MSRALELYDIVNHSFPGEVLLEDRLHLTLGARLRDLKNQGYVVSVIVGDKVITGIITVRHNYCHYILVRYPRIKQNYI